MIVVDFLLKSITVFPAIQTSFNSLELTCTLVTFTNRTPLQELKPDLEGRPPTNRTLLTKPFQFYFLTMIDAYETTT